MSTHLVIVALSLLSSLLASGLGGTEYYIQPESCPSEPCQPLSNYVSSKERYFTSGSSFLLSEGEHHLNSSLMLESVSNITLTGVGERTRLILYPGASISWISSSDVALSWMKIVYQGGTSNSALLFEDSQSVQLLNVVFIRSASGGTPSPALALLSTTVNVTNCSFSNGYNTNGGAIVTRSSSVAFSNVHFFNNTAEVSGGAMAASNNCTLIFTGNNTFERNRGRTLLTDPSTGGGAIHLMQSYMELSGFNFFRENGPVGDEFLSGGGIVACTSVLKVRDRAEFSQNSGTYAGVMIGFDAVISLQGRLTFTDNRRGGAVSLFGCNFSCGGEVEFINNEIFISEGFGSAVYSENSTLFFNGTIDFVNNTATNGVGGAFFTFNSSTLIQGDVSFVDNVAHRDVGGALCVDRSILEYSGHVTFRNNSAGYRGGGMYAIDSSVIFSGNGSFVENRAAEGGGMGLEGSAQLVLKSPVEINFDRNWAESVGGGMLVVDPNTISQCQNISVEKKDCFFRVMAPDDESVMAVHLNFSQNYASNAGTVLYGGSLQLCRPRVNDEQLLIDSFQFFESISTFEFSKGDSGSYISSDPLRVCFCNNGTADCLEEEVRTVYTRRGKLFALSVITVGQRDFPVPSIVRAYIKDNDDFTELTPQGYQIDRVCTDIGFRLLTGDVNKTVVLYPDGPCGNTINTRRKVHVILLPCPPGFDLRGQECVCESRILNLDEENECDIDTGLLRRPGNTWMRPSFDDNGTYLGFIFNKNCPFGYCRPAEDTIYLNFTSNTTSSDICTENRTGSLCGHCREGYSLVMTNLHCELCSNGYLGLLVFFALAGVALITMLLGLHMTVANGTINGLILYANMVNINSLIFFPNDAANILTVFIAWLNLDLGIYCCLYDGMDFYAYAWLQYVFPLYLWFLVSLIIIVNKLNRRVGRFFGSNPVAVLATVILMSYTKLMQAAIITLAYTDLEQPDGTSERVWLFDANIEYFRGKHLVLSIVAILVIFLLLLPYIFLLLLGYRLQAYSGKRAFQWFNKLKPFLDAYYAPYHRKTRYWTGFMLLVRGALYLVFALNTLNNSSANLVTISSVFTAVAIVPWLSSRIYEKYYLDILEASFILNICILATATYHVRSIEGNQMVVTYLSVGVAFLEFVGIVVFHIYLRLRGTKLLESIKSGMLVERTRDLVRRVWKKSSPLEPAVEYTKRPEPSRTVVDLREPLLEDD